MIDINLTLVCQMAHFLFAFWLMRRFLWRPTIDLLDRKAARREHLNRQLTREQAALTQKQIEADAVWRDAQRAFLANSPSTARAVCIKTFARREPAGCPFQVTDAMVKSLASDLIKKVQSHEQ